jgi:SAM-dependent methyltransferase
MRSRDVAGARAFHEAILGDVAMSVDENRRRYERRFVAADYASRSGLKPAEEAIFRRYEDEIRGARILDLGVGGGRTTSYLADLASAYIGVDYSPVMIERCRRRFPDVVFEFGDARDLSRFAAESFDFVLFSANGIDAVAHQDRLKILQQVRRTLKEHGLFVFSSHNRNFRIPMPWDLRHFAVKPLRDPVRFAKRIVSYPIGIINYWRRASRSEIQDDYCIVVDAGDLYSLMHYRMTPAAQQRQLTIAGFSQIEAVGRDGRWLSAQEAETAEDPYIHYACRRSSAS